MRRPTCTEITENFGLWESHVDPYGNMSESEFDALSEEEKLGTIHELWPQDCNCGEDDD